MTKPELHRRLATMPETLRIRVFEMIGDGYGAMGIVNNTVATLKQANAVFEWRTRYGGIVPTDSAIR